MYVFQTSHQGFDMQVTFVKLHLCLSLSVNGLLSVKLSPQKTPRKFKKH